jgi:hypothetical protein
MVPASLSPKTAINRLPAVGVLVKVAETLLTVELLPATPEAFCTSAGAAEPEPPPNKTATTATRAAKTPSTKAIDRLRMADFFESMVTPTY